LTAALAGGLSLLAMAAMQLAVEAHYRISAFVVVQHRIDALETALDDIAYDLREYSEAKQEYGKIAPMQKKIKALGKALDYFDHYRREKEKSVTYEQQIALLETGIGELRDSTEELRSYVNSENTKYRDAIRAEFGLLETLIKQMMEKIAASSLPPEPADGGDNAGEATSADARQEDGIQPADVLDDKMLDIIRYSIKAEKIDLFLQPIVTLPDRQTAYYESLTRLQNRAGDAIMPEHYVHVAENSGLMPLIDNVLLLRAVQIIRRFMEHGTIRGLFCNISLSSLVDMEFFPEFVRFMSKNQDLSDVLFFEFGQEVVQRFGPVETESLKALSDLGFRFSMDKVTDLSVDFQDMQAMHFKFIKISANILLKAEENTKTNIHPADMKDYLARFGMKLIVEKIEAEHSLGILTRYGIELGQGHIFSEPRPVRPELLTAGQQEK
jgi:cyclic-di-GMP phosphodiesterase TipF (flagellum assembly factor)